MSVNALFLKSYTPLGACAAACFYRVTRSRLKFNKKNRQISSSQFVNPLRSMRSNLNATPFEEDTTMKRTSLLVITVLGALVLSVALVPAPAMAGHNHWSVNIGGYGHHGSSVHFGSHGWGVNLSPGCYHTPIYYPPVYYPTCYDSYFYGPVCYY